MIDEPPFITHANVPESTAGIRTMIRRLTDTLPADRRRLVERFKPVDAMRKVAGVGSVGTRCLVVLLDAGDAEPLFLQAKQSNASVLEPYLGRSTSPSHAERVVAGELLIQSESHDILGWSRSARSGAEYHWRRLRPAGASINPRSLDADGLSAYARACAWTLARAHARTGDPRAIAKYLGGSDAFDRAAATFARTYADQVEEDYRAFVTAHHQGRVPAAPDR